MAAAFKTKAIEVSLPVDQVGSDLSVSRTVDIQPATVKMAYDTFGVEAADCLVIYDDVDGADYYQLHGIVTYAEKSYSIIADPMVWDTLPTTSHVQVLIQRKR